MKRNYQMPSIKVVAFKVEEGFQGSQEDPFSVTYVETFGSINDNNPDIGWTASDYIQTGEHTVFGNN